MGITCITLSPTPVDRRVPQHIEYINAVSIFRTPACEYSARIRAIRQVRTACFFFLDSDDEYGNMDFTTAGLLAGVEHKVRESSVQAVYPPHYSRERHISNPWLIHNAVCFNTQAALKALEDMPAEGAYYMHQMLPFVILERHPYVTNVGLRYNWRITPEGQHTKAGPMLENTKAWLQKRALILN